MISGGIDSFRKMFKKSFENITEVSVANVNQSAVVHTLNTNRAGQSNVTELPWLQHITNAIHKAAGDKKMPCKVLQNATQTRSWKPGIQGPTVLC